MRFNETREITAVLLILPKHFNIDMPFDIYECIWFKLEMMIDTMKLHFDASLIDLDLDSRSQECKKAKISAAIISQIFQLIWTKFVIMLRHVIVMNLILI